MTVLMISPGYPAEMAFFTRGLGQAGVRVIGLGDQSPDALPAEAKPALDHYVHTGSLAAEDHVIGLVREMARRIRIDQVECLWEPYMVLAARLREVLGLPGLTVEQTVPFRDKERMKQLLDAAGLRTPWHVAARTVADVWAAAERVGYPLIVKPIDGAGSADTYRAESTAELDAILPMIRHVPQVSVEEFVEAEEFTYDTICAGGNVLVENICQYHPRPLQTKIYEWVSPVTMALRDLDEPGLQGGRELGRAVLRALGFTDGFTHMPNVSGSPGVTESIRLDGAVYASPIAVDGVIVVATENDSVYAFDAQGRQLWHVKVGSPSPAQERACGDIDPLGITSTPIYSARTGNVYLVAEHNGKVGHDMTRHCRRRFS